MKFENQVAVITGGAQGIGLGVAKRLGSEGAKIALVDMSAERLDVAKDTLTGMGITAEVFAANVTKEDDVKSTMANIVAKLGRVDILVQSAGITGKTGIKSHEVDLADFNAVFAVNTTGIFLMCKEALPIMLKQNYGRIVNIASIAGKEGNAGMLAYSSSKAAVIGLTKAMGKEYAETPITINAVAPAVVRTEMVDRMPDEQVKYMTDKIPMKRTGEIDEISGLVSYIASKECSFTTAFCFDCSGGRAVY